MLLDLFCIFSRVNMVDFQLNLTDFQQMKKRLKNNNIRKKNKVNIARSMIVNIKFDKTNNGMKPFC